MAKIGLFCLAVLLPAAVISGAMLHSPFPQGYLMGNLGTIIAAGGPGGRSPMVSSAYMNDTVDLGLTATVCTFYDDMDNYQDRYIAAVTGGGWFARKRMRMKIAVTLFDALGTYREQSGFISCAMALYRSITVGVDLSGTRSYMPGTDFTPLTLGTAGVSLFIPLRLVSLSCTVDQLTVRSSRRDGADPQPRIICGIHTSEHAFGAQGVRIEINPRYEHPVSLALGQEFRIISRLAIHGAVANNPLFFGLGVTVFIGRGHASAALVNHPVLGWSKGFSAEYGWNPFHGKNREGN